MNEYTTIQLSKTVVNNLKKLKMHPRQSFDEVISNLLKSKTLKEEYFKIMYDAQKTSMKKLWDNKDDEDWDKCMQNQEK